MHRFLIVVEKAGKSLFLHILRISRDALQQEKHTDEAKRMDARIRSSPVHLLFLRSDLVTMSILPDRYSSHPFKIKNHGMIVYDLQFQEPG